MITALPASAAQAVTAAPGEETTAAALLAGLPERAEQPDGFAGAGTWLAAWWGTDPDGDGCTTSAEVAIQESVVPATVALGCKVTGSWFSYTDGLTWTQTTQIAMPLTVTRAEAWESGAHAWTPDQRVRYAADTEFPPAIDGMTGALSTSRRDADPSGWVPPLEGARCRYAVSWVLVKTRWDLAVDPAERLALQDQLSGGCGATVVTAPVRGLTLTTPVAPTPDRLLAGEELVEGTTLLSQEGRYHAEVRDGRLYLHRRGEVLWSTGTADGPGARLRLQEDGNLVLYSAGGRALWSSRTAGQDVDRLVVEDDQTLALYSSTGALVWHSRSDPPPAPVVGNTIVRGQSLAAGESITSPDGRSRLVMQTDGNLVVYSGSHVVWHTGTAGNPGATLAFQHDANLVLSTATGRPLFDTGTSRTAADRVVLQDDANLVVYSGSTTEWRIDPATFSPPPAGSTLVAGQYLRAGQSAASPDGRYRLVMQADGNLVLYSPAGAVWASRSGGTPGRFVMQFDGNAVVYDRIGQPLWNSQTGRPGARLVVQDDGNVVVYDTAGRPLWHRFQG